MADARMTFETNPLADFFFWLARPGAAAGGTGPATLDPAALRAVAEQVSLLRISDFADVIERLEEQETLPAAGSFPAGHAPDMPYVCDVGATLRRAARHWPAYGRYWRDARHRADAAVDAWRAENAEARPLEVLERLTRLAWPADACRVLACPSLQGSLSSMQGLLFGAAGDGDVPPPRLATLVAHEGAHVMVAGSLRRHEDLNELIAALGDAGWQPAEVRANLGEILAIALQHRILVELGHGSDRDLYEGRLGESLRAAAGAEDRRSEMHGEFFEEVYWEVQYEWDAFARGGPETTVLDHLAACVEEVAAREGWLPA